MTLRPDELARLLRIAVGSSTLWDSTAAAHDSRE
jgi:hypothetical protein